MKKLFSLLICAAMVVLLPLPAAAAVPGVTVDTFMLSNEKGTSGEGGLIDKLIAAGYGNNSLYEVLQVLQPLSGGAIPVEFMAALAACPSDCDAKTAPLNDFSDVSNNPIGIGSDGGLIVAPIYGRDYYNDARYTTSDGRRTSAGNILFTSAANQTYWIDAAVLTTKGTSYYYKVFAIAWMPETKAADTPTTFVLSNEEGGLIDKLIAAGYGDESLFEVLQVLKPLSNGAIPDDFVTTLAACPPDCEAKTIALKNFSSEFNNPIGISADGTLIVAQIYGRDYIGATGYTTTNGHHATAGDMLFTAADSEAYIIDAGTLVFGGEETYYKAFAIAWMPETKDVPDIWALPEVRAAEQRGLVPPALQSDYTKTVTRSEFCSLAVLCVEQVKQMTAEEYITSQQLTLPAASPFTDIAGLMQKEQADILAAYTLKIVSGTSLTTFNPGDRITREQAAKMLTSAAAALGKTTEAVLPTFADGGQIASWAAPYIGYVYNAKIMNGVGDNRFDPSGGYQRQQAYMTMLRLYKYMTGAV